MRDIYAEVAAERKRQDARWGTEPRDAFVLATVLAEECGEVASAIHDVRFVSRPWWRQLWRILWRRGTPITDVRAEAIQVAAVAIQIIQRLDEGRIVW